MLAIAMGKTDVAKELLAGGAKAEVAMITACQTALLLESRLVGALHAQLALSNGRVKAGAR